MNTRPVLALAVAAALACTAGCGNSGPSTRQDLCAKFDSLGNKVLHANGFFDNAVFSTAGDLADLASRYQEQDLSADARALKSIADSDSTNSLALMNATTGTASVCGHPLINPLGG